MQKTAMSVAQARGVILEAAATCSVPVAEYTPMQAKNASDRFLVKQTSAWCKKWSPAFLNYQILSNQMMPQML